MSHRKVVHSQGNVPFSWEDKPGVSKSKITHQECPTDMELRALIPSPCHSDFPLKMANGKKIPPPPCPFPPPSRTSSRKGLWQQEDPFLAALKECTKGVRSGKMPGESKNGVNSKRNKFIRSLLVIVD
ncbi:hypothetical protein F0562_006248 [Nyssa sinensis]|uniref:Uncharacterized protein n=1 Tax=Nyssa sinensis TaxID=561372 RepID=A0A5J5AMT3_9ASTE|nr:hypothetical protein F0562_006248 [Nyssa sinensis]